jgi:hypothetical protein
MKAYWDSSAVIEACNNPALRVRLHRERGFTHTLAEVFSTLTGGNLAFRLGADEAAKTVNAKARYHRPENPSCRPDEREMIAHNSRSVIQARLHIGASQLRVFFQNVLDGITRSEKLQDRLHRDARAANHRPPLANIRFG